MRTVTQTEANMIRYE